MLIFLHALHILDNSSLHCSRLCLRVALLSPWSRTYGRPALVHGEQNICNQTAKSTIYQLNCLTFLQTCMQLFNKFAIK